MSLHRSLHIVLILLLPISIASTLYLYLYPLFNGCAFPAQHGSAAIAFADTLSQHVGSPVDAAARAPFRLLALADPQLEGDSSLPDPDDAFLPSLCRHWDRVVSAPSIRDFTAIAQQTLKDIATKDIPKALQATRKRIDLFGNDYYLAHIYRALHWWAKPTHVAVLGDLIGSQWVTDEEFAWRGWRYWNRVFRHGSMVEEEISTREVGDVKEEELAADRGWERRIVNVLGNHDAGYAGDMTAERIARFERVFGKANWDVKFTHHLPNNSSVTPTLHLVVLNSLNLDTPVLAQDLQTTTYDFINSHVIAHSGPVEDRSSFTLLLTHLPLHKDAGVCVDPPSFNFYGDSNGGGVKEQNHLSAHVSAQGILQGIFGMSAGRDAPGGGRGRDGAILTGHDHEGCDVWHHVPSGVAEAEEGDVPEQAENPWRAVRWRDRGAEAMAETGIREVTLRSMMGSYGGNAGLFSAWFEEDVGEWRFEIRMCALGIQHWWWGVHILDLITVLLVVVTGAVETRRLVRRESAEGTVGGGKTRGVALKKATVTGGNAVGEKHDVDGSGQRSAQKKKRRKG